jgi:uncharacterized protein YegP (UPF0339 family)
MGMFGPSFAALINAKIVELDMSKKNKQKAETNVTSERKTSIRFEVYKDANAEHRWRMVDGNNRIVGVSGEGFTRSADARRAIENIMVDLANPAKPMGLTVVGK